MNTVPLKRIADIIAGQSPSSEDVEPYECGQPFLQGNAEFSAMVPVPRLQCSSAPKVAHLGDVLLSVRAPVGAVNIADQMYGIGRGLCAVRASTPVREYLWWYLQSQTSALRAVATGSTFEAVSSADVGSLEVPVLASEQMSAIAGFLDRETAKIDALIAKQEQLIATLREDRAATITQSVTKGLDPNVEMKDSGVEWLGAVPVHWTVSRFSRHIAINAGQVDPRVEPYRDMILIAPNHVEAGTGRLVCTETAADQGADSGKYQVTAGQVIYSKIRPNLSKVVIAPTDCLCSADMYGLAADPDQLSTDFMLYMLLSQPFTDYVIDSSMRVAMPKVNHDSLGAAPVWIPPKDEQVEIARYVEARCARIDALIAKSTEMIETLREYRSALITDAVTGKIDVRGVA
ncbi:restriction endonuclease subunit S [Rhodococcus sp. BH2-1]|nr:restriction endonuclease subunit S [Rhodococcus sp. BH2-1]